jgi:ubiquinone/menaquinone biosynthesis C-methylase UbiE
MLSKIFKMGTHHMLDTAYEHHYQTNTSNHHIYPAEFVVRTFLGTSYPQLKMNKDNYQGSSILDLGFGDGRNFILLNQLGFKIYGVEISQTIIELAKQKFAPYGFPLDLRLGRNANIPFHDKTFDYALGCHAIYYVDAHQHFDDNLAEIARVIKPQGFLIASLPKTTGSIVKGAKPLGNGHVEITNDHLGLRNGSVFRVFESKQEIEDTFSPYFEKFVIGGCDDDYFGIQQNVWILVCSRRS